MSGSMPATRQLDWLISMTAMIVVGHGNAAVITAIGDAVNTASRLESLTKNFACELVVSEETVSRAGFDLSDFPLHEIEDPQQAQVAGGQNTCERRGAAHSRRWPQARHHLRSALGKSDRLSQRSGSL
jgi:hypothetical protein